MQINPTKRLNKLIEHGQNLLQSDFSDWAAKDRISSNFDRLNEKMLVAYNRCGGGPNGTDDDEDEPSKGYFILSDFSGSVSAKAKTTMMISKNINISLFYNVKKFG